MNIWIGVAFILLLCLIPCFLVCIRGDAVNRLVGLEGASTIATILFLVLAVASNRPSFVDISLTLALLSFGSGLVFARFLERWL